MTALLALHVPAIPVYAWFRGESALHAMLESIPVVLALLAALSSRLGRTAQSAAAALGLMICSGMLVHLSNGLIEAHFHFFAMVPVIALYEAWLPFGLGVGYVLVHHSVMGTLSPRSIYNHPAAWERPWLFAGVHATFLASAAIACIVNWLLHERARDSQGSLLSTLAHRAEHDALTGLPNRAAFLNHGPVTEGGRRNGNGSVSVLMLDLDRFKEVNDTLGHSFGDRLLQQVAQRLDSATRPDDKLARLGGDEFAVLLNEADERCAKSVADRLLEVLHADFVVDGMLLNVDASVGAATHHYTDGRDELEVDTLLRQADIAMYEAKRTHKGFSAYDVDADDHTRERLTLLAELRRGIDDDQLVVHYQPKISVTDNSISGLEALVRWEHPKRGLLPPVAFIPIAESTALITPLTLRVIDAVLHQTRLWLDEGRAVPVSVNISPRSLLESDFTEAVLSRLLSTGVPASHLCLEITESTLMVDPERARLVLEEFSRAGIRLSIDDFGTGYSSMSYLRHLPIDELKIDRSFVAGMLDHREDGVLVQSAIDLAHNLGLSVVAEGVETADVLSALADGGCDIAQGFLFARPCSAAEIEPFLITRPALSQSIETPLATESYPEAHQPAFS